MGERPENARHLATAVAPARKPGRSRLGAASAASARRLAEPADLYRVPLWALTKIVYTLAPASLLLRLATLRGTLDSFSSPLRHEAREALARHMPETTGAKNLPDVLRRHFQFRGRGRFVRLWPQIRDFTGSEKIAVQGLDHLDEALSHGKGAILVTAHFGYARLIKPVLRSRGREVLLVGNLRPGMPDFRLELFGLRAFTQAGSFVHTRLLRLPRWSRIDARFQETTGIDLPTGMNLRPHVAALRRNATLIILIDGRRAQALRAVAIHGMQVYMAPGAVSLARATGAALLPTFVVDDPTTRSTRLRLVIHPALELQITEDAEGDLDAWLRQFAAVYEDHVRAQPHNWYWHAMRDGVLDPQLVER